jgi:hypothetical protein
MCKNWRIVDNCGFSRTKGYTEIVSSDSSSSFLDDPVMDKIATFHPWVHPGPVELTNIVV